MKNTIVWCGYCGKEGELGTDMQDESRRGCTGHDTWVYGCKDIPSCIDRQRSAEWKAQQDAEWYKAHPRYARK